MTRNVRSWRLLVATSAVAAALAGGSGAMALADPLTPAPPGPGYPAPVQPAGAPVPMTAPITPALTGPPAGVAPVLPPAPPAPVPATSGTLRDYFAAKDVHLEAQRPETLTALKITLPMPLGWSRVPDPNVPDAFAVIADRRSGALYTPNAQVVVYRLTGHFDAAEAITHGFVDCRQLFAWQSTNASLAEFGGLPSSIIEGTYRQNDMTLNTSQRHVIVPTGADSYLVTLTVTTGAGQSVGNAPATDAIINGFRVERPGATPHLSPAADAAPVTAPGPPARVGAAG